MKYILVGDMHFGAKKNSEDFSGRILDFMDSVVDYAQTNAIDALIQFGDYFDSRNSINVATLNYAIEGAKKWNRYFGKKDLTFILGNHDLYHLHKIDHTSMKVLTPYVHVIDRPVVLDDGIVVAPWIVDQAMWDRVIELSNENRVLMSHLELNGFMVNDHYLMEHGYSHTELKNYDLVLTGHYHSQQKKDNVQYIGTPYPISMNEANESHGFWVFDSETLELEFIEYTGIRAISVSYKDIIEDKVDLSNPDGTSIRIEFPDDLDDETMIEEVRSSLEEKGFQDIKVKYRGNKAKEILEEDVEEISNVENIDQLVISYLDKSSDVEGVDKDKLKTLYKKAMDTV